MNWRLGMRMVKFRRTARCDSLPDDN